MGAGEALDTEAVKRPRSTGNPRPDDTVESETKSASPDSDETATDLGAKITVVDSLSCRKPSIDLTNDAMDWSGKFQLLNW